MLAVLWWSTAAALVLLAGLIFALLVVPALAAVAATREHSLAAQRSALQVQVLDVLHGCAELTVLGALHERVRRSAIDANDLQCTGSQNPRRLPSGAKNGPPSSQ